jgi:dTDP-4-amino-4,6-dideoxygalactose transaminase
MKKAVCDVLDSERYIKGEKLKEFQKKFAQFVSAKYAIGVSSWTAVSFYLY